MIQLRFNKLTWAALCEWAGEWLEWTRVIALELTRASEILDGWMDVKKDLSNKKYGIIIG